MDGLTLCNQIVSSRVARQSVAQRTYTSGRTSLSAMISNKVLEAELEQCLDDGLRKDGGMKDDCKGTQKSNLRMLSGRLIGRERFLVSHEYKRGRSALGSSTAPAPPPRLPCSKPPTMWIPRRSSDDFCICATTSPSGGTLE